LRITVSRDTVGRALGVLILLLSLLTLSYVATAWVWWELNPGLWTMAGRGTALGFVVFLLSLRWLVSSVTIADSAVDQ